MSDHKGFDAEWPPTNPVPAGFEFAGVYTWGPNTSRITPLAEQRALEAAGLYTFAYGVGFNQCPQCVTGPMTAATGTAHGQAFANASKSRGITVCCFDWESGGNPPTEQLPGFVEYVTAASQAVHDAGCLVGHYGTPGILGTLMPAQGGHAIMDFVVLTDWTQSMADNAVSLWWRQRFPLFCRQYGGNGILDFLVCSQEFFDALSPLTEGVMIPAEPTSVSFPNYGGHTIGGGIYQSWKARGGLDGPGLPLNDEHPSTAADGKTYTVQDFERDRAEWHPDVKRPFNVQWGLVNLELLAARDALAKAPKSIPWDDINRAVDALDIAVKKAQGD